MPNFKREPALEDSAFWWLYLKSKKYCDIWIYKNIEWQKIMKHMIRIALSRSFSFSFPEIVKNCWRSWSEMSSEVWYFVWFSCLNWFWAQLSFVLSWLRLAEVSRGEEFVVGGAFAIQVLVSEMEVFLESFWWDRQLNFEYNGVRQLTVLS